MSSKEAREHLLESRSLGDWSSGMIPASGAGGREFDSRITPIFICRREGDAKPDTVSEWLRR